MPDQDIHPTATGAAIETVNKHQEKQPLVFYAGWFCPFVARTWLALEEKGIPYQYVEVNPYKKEKHFLDINPKGLVPAIEYEGKALYESLILCEFLEDAYPDTRKLLPADAYTRAYSRIWIDHITKNFLPNFMRLLQYQEPERQAEAREDLYKHLRAFTNEIKGPYFLGEEFSLVDIAIAPWISRDYIIEEHRGYKREDVSSRWNEYAQLVLSRPSIKAITSDHEHYNTIYGRYLRDEAQSEAAKAIRAGKAIP